MEIYVISPIKNLELMEKGDRIFVLAHLWVMSNEYKSFILKQKAQGKYLTLDNSAAERSLVTEDVLIEICHELMPDEVIAPDVLFDSKATVSNLIQFKLRMQKEGLLNQIKIFFCPQGSNQTEWVDCYMRGLADPHVEVIGFSKIAIPRAFLGPNIPDDQGIKEARHMAYNYLKVHDMLHKPIHCLGQGDPTEFEYYDHPMMRSTDSVYPVLAGDEGVDFIDRKAFQRIPTKHDYLQSAQIDSSKYPLIESNIQFLKKCCMKDNVTQI